MRQLPEQFPEKFTHMLSFLVNTVLSVAIMYNIHLSFKAVDRSERKFFKHYFVSMALLLAMDNMLSFLLYRIPYYKIFKVSLLLWLSVPKSTGPHFIYNVYIKNIDRLFEGDIDSVINNFRQYYQQLCAKYHAAVKKSSKGGEISFGKDSVSIKEELNAPESSEAEASFSAASSEEEKPAVLRENK